MTESTIELPAGVVEFAEKAPIRVLHVDDEAGFLSAAKECLEMRGAFEVDTALSVKEAVEKMKSKEYDVIVCDYKMPEKDGLQFLEELRKNGNFIPFILFTGKGGEEVAIKGMSLDAEGYISKIGDPETVYCELAYGIVEAVNRRKAEIMCQTLFENTGTAMCILEEDKTISLVNKQFEELSGYSKEEIEGRKWTEFVTGEYLERMEKYHIERRKKGGKAPKQYAFDFVSKKGEIRNVLLNIELIPGTKKSLVSLIDITENKKAEEALRESEEAYRALINGMNDTAWVIGFDGKFIDVNDAAVKVLGYSREEFLKMGPQDIDSTLTTEEIKELIRNMPKDKIQVFETTHVAKDGRVIPVEISSSLVTYKGKTAILSIARDITERKKAEEKLNQIMEELKLVNEKLSVVGRWTRHDARNKLSVIKSNVYLVKKKLPSDHIALKYLNEIELACNQIVKIFDFASTYEMLGVEERTYVDVGKSFEEAVTLSSGLSIVEVVNECHGLMVLADSQLRQLFHNLIDNSLRHGEKVSQIKIYYKEDETDKDKLKLVYEDNGVGVSEEARRNLFKEGYGKGTGYGLYLTARLCEMYGWKIQETGEYGKGAQFTITIPKINKKGEQLYKIGQ
ncbi:MAG: PAS domain S-box protein [Candidatus Bathyarchaeales archaeon]